MHILLIDDEISACEGLAKLADEKYGIAIEYFHNHDEGFAELLKNPKYQALILDAKCLINKEQETESDDALDYALKKLADFEQKTGRYLPFAVNTGYEYFAQFFASGLKERKARIFSKAKPKGELFEYLIAEINNAENTQIEKQYADVFEIFTKGYLDNDVKQNLLNILKNMSKVEIAEVRKNLALIRVTKENILQILLTHTKFSQPNLIFSLSNDLIHKVASNYGSHNPKSKDIAPTKYTVISLVNALLEILLWFKTEMEK